MEKNEIVVCVPQEEYKELVKAQLRIELIKDHIKLKYNYITREQVLALLGIEEESEDDEV